MNIVHRRCKTGITVAVRFTDRLSVPEKDHIHAPGIDREGADVVERSTSLFQTFFQFIGKSGKIPVESAILFVRMIGKTVYFLQLQFSIFDPTDDCAPAGGAQVKCQMFTHDHPRLL